MGIKSQIEQICFSEKGNLRKRILFSIILSLIGFAIIIWFLIRLLNYDGHLNYNHSINLTDAGQVGDFIGGLAGTIFSIVGIILLYETLSLQRKEFEETRNVLKQEQFENTYFSLINFYKDSLEKITEKKYDINWNMFIIDGLDYFASKREELYNNFLPTNSILKDSKFVRNTYTNFYLQNKTSLAIYFRTLYRIYNFIDESSFDYNVKMRYAKIFRAQLNEDELFFIYYNAYSNFGLKSRELINKYNFTKHLPFFSKLEYKAFAEKLNPIERSSVEKLLDDLKAKIKYLIKNKNYNLHVFEYLNKKYKIIVHFSKTKLSIELNINNSQEINFINLTDGYGIQNFTEDELENLLKIFLKDLFEYSSFKLVNKGLTHKTKVDITGDIIKIVANTSNIKEQELLL